MATPLQTPPPGFDELSIDEQIEYIQLLWDRIAADPQVVPVPNWHRDVVNERLRAYRESPEDLRSWDAVKERLRRRLDDTSG